MADMNGETAYAFTASKPEGGTLESYNNDLDRHVSFQVDVEPRDGVDGLRIRRWLPGLCFFRGRERKKVMFPWPDNLIAIGR